MYIPLSNHLSAINRLRYEGLRHYCRRAESEWNMAQTLSRSSPVLLLITCSKMCLPTCESTALSGSSSK